MDCTFCKNSAPQLAEHRLCNLCLVHLECCEINEILSEGGPPSFLDEGDDDEEMDEQQSPVQNNVNKVECDICLDQVQKDELQQHREMCSPRLVFRCALCSYDFLSKEGLWNHLDLHEISDESKELYYSEVRITRELYKCILCNDQRGYADKKYWEHVHEDHDGYFLRCTDCGERFRSKKNKEDHAFRNCKPKGTIEATSNTHAGREVISLNLPLQINVLANFSKIYEQKQGSATNGNKGTLQMSTNVDTITCKRGNGDSANDVTIDFKQAESKKEVSFDSKFRYSDKEILSEKELRHDTHDHERLSSKRKHVDDKSFPCGLCGNISEDFLSLALHMKQCHSEELNYQKLMDALKTREPTNSDDKESQLPVNQQEKLPVDSCQICSEPMADRELLPLHVKESHQLITCTDCGKTFIDVGSQKTHKASAAFFDDSNSKKQSGIKCLCSGTQRNDDESPNHRCPCCTEKFQDKKQLQRHMSEHVDEIINKKLKTASPQKDGDECPNTTTDTSETNQA